jgi:V-type H+-transporting ATPase subunit a
MATPSVFFPEPMEYVQLLSPTDAAYYLIREIALDGQIELIDFHAGSLTAPKRYTENYILCEEADRCLSFLQQRLAEVEGLLPPPPPYQQVLQAIAGLTLTETVERIRGVDAELREKIRITQDLEQQQAQAARRLVCLRYFRPLIEHERTMRAVSPSASGTLELSLVAGAEMIQSVVGLVPAVRFSALRKSIYRLSRGNAIVHRGDSPGANVPYAVFLHSQTLLVKVKSVCQSFSPDVFEFQAEAGSLAELETQLSAQIEQQSNVEARTRNVNHQFLVELAREFWTWRVFVARERQIWAVLDYGDFERAEGTACYSGWMPKRFKDRLVPMKNAAQQASGTPRVISVLSSPAEEHRDLVVPSFIEENEFSTAFQTLNDAYGVPNYDELNGGAFYGMYPFLFGVMFGDIGHAFFYVLAALALLVGSHIVKKKKIDLGDMGETIFSMKWLLVLASICALYCGFIYNECFGLPIYMAKSAWTPDGENPGKWKKEEGYVYRFGMDPGWFFKDNELIFLNSYKMKLSVVMGMSQMIFGMFLQLIKHVHRRDWLEIAVVWLPEMLYLVPFFGYLVVIILVKWGTQFPENSEGVNLIQMLIGMILSFGSKDPALELYPTQWGIQLVIVIIFAVSIPAMLFIKPIIECVQLKGTAEFNVLEIFVMNLIHVIEFALGALSHTASYLRLWALSLAHSQLSKVLYEELFLQIMNMGFASWVRGIIMVVGFAGFAALTVAILLGMEAFSALLHAIRLMWVEFSSKFYEGMGTAFRPLSLETALKGIGIPSSK